jgi:hypothetical protein
MRCQPHTFRPRGSLAPPCPRRSEGGWPGVLLVAVVLSLALTGCGKRGPPEPPPDVPNTFPMPYPSE